MSVHEPILVDRQAPCGHSRKSNPGCRGAPYLFTAPVEDRVHGGLAGLYGYVG